MNRSERLSKWSHTRTSRKIQTVLSSSSKTTLNKTRVACRSPQGCVALQWLISSLCPKWNCPQGRLTIYLPGLRTVQRKVDLHSSKSRRKPSLMSKLKLLNSSEKCKSRLNYSSSRGKKLSRHHQSALQPLISRKSGLNLLARPNVDRSAPLSKAISIVKALWSVTRAQLMYLRNSQLFSNLSSQKKAEV